MTSISVKKQIAAPVEAVFARATNLREAVDTIPGIVKMEVLTDGPIAKGTRFRETRIMFKKEAVEEMEISRFEPPHRYDVDADNHGCFYHTEFHFRPKDGGTELEMIFGATPHTFGAKIMSMVVFKPMLKSTAKLIEKDLDAIKAAVEGTSAAEAS